ncbi:MAG: hypothetical protein FJ288_11975 [Planctomycetes bacterium]|nr:hypothetical protein [Planctomycetota bacterium]
MSIEGRKDIGKIFAEGKLIDRALRMAAREALLRHKKAGVPIVVWRRGKIVRIPAGKIKVPRRGRRRAGRCGR